MALNCQNLLQFNDLCRRILFNYEMSHKKYRANLYQQRRYFLGE